MKTPRCLLLAAGILALGAGLPVFAQISQQTRQITVTAVIPVLMNLTLDSRNTVTFIFTQRDYAADGTGTKEVVSGTTLTVASNTRWILQVAADSSTFTFAASADITGATNPNKTCGDLWLKKTGAADYIPVTNLNQEIARGEPGGNTAPANVIPVNYRLNTDVAKDPPGTYTLTLTYTLMPQ
jgi:hypothetical protein